MRKTIFNIVLVLVSMAMLTSCDPGCSEECVVKNQSGHDVVLTRYYCIHSGGWNDWQPVEDSVRTHVDTLKNGTETKYVGGHLGNTCKMCIESMMKREYWGDSVAFAFDDGTTRVFYPDSDTVWGPYAFWPLIRNLSRLNSKHIQNHKNMKIPHNSFGFVKRRERTTRKHH